MAVAKPTNTIRVNWPRLKSFDATVTAMVDAVSAWPLSESAGQTYCYDRIGGNKATVSGVTLGATGILFEDAATSASFDGTNDYLSIADATNLDTGDTFSFFAVIKRTATGTKHYIAHKGTGSWGIYVSAADALTFEEVGTADVVASTVTIGTSATSICVTKTGATVKLYVNGIDVTGTVTNQTLANTATALEIGRSAVPGNYFAGTIAWPVLFNDDLTATEVSELHVAAMLGQFGFAGSNIEQYVESVSRSRGVNADYSGDQIGELTLECDDNNGIFEPLRNLAPNPSLEWGLTDWTAAQTGVLAWKAAGMVGTYAGQVTATGTGDGASQTITDNFPADVAVSAGIYLKSVSGSTAIRLTLTDGTTTATADFTITTSGAFYGPVTLTPVAARTSVTFTVATNAAAAAVWQFDGLQVNFGSDTNTYVDGPSRPWLSPGAAVHWQATYDGTTYPMFYGEIERLDPLPEQFRASIVAYDALKKYAVPVDLELVRSTALRARYGLIDAAIRRIDRGYENLLLGQTTALGWTFGTGASGGSTITVVNGTTGPGTYNSGGAVITWPIMRDNRYYVLTFDARYKTALEYLHVRFGSASTYSTYATPGSGDSAAVGLPALTASYQTYRVIYANAGADQHPYIRFLSGAASTGVEIQNVMITEGLGAHDYLAYGAPSAGRKANWLWDDDGLTDHSVLPAGYWIPGFANRISNPECVSATTDWSTSTNAFITLAGASIARVAAGGYYGGSELTFATALEITPQTPTGTNSGARLSPSGTYLSGKSYRFSGFVHDNSVGGSEQWTVGIGSNGTPADVATATVDVTTSSEWSITWTPTGDRTDARIFIRSNGGGSTPIKVSGMQVIPTWGTESTSDYMRTGFTLDQPATITSVASGVTHSTSLSVTTAAVTGSGVARLVDLHHVSGVVYTFSCWLTASSGTPSVVVGLGDPFGADSSPESSTLTVTLSTTPQRVVVQFTGSDTSLYGQLVAWVAASSASAFTFYIDDASITLGTSTQSYIPDVLALDTADVDIIPGKSFAAADAVGSLAELNSVTLARHWIAPQNSHPFGKYTTSARQGLTAKTVDETYVSTTGDGIQNLAGFEMDRQAIRHAVIVEYDASSVMPADGTSTTLTGVLYAENAASIGRYGLVTGLSSTTYTVNGSTWLNGPAGTDSTAQDIADLLITRYKVPRTRPKMTVVDHWPEQMERVTDDLLAVTYLRAGIVGVRYLLLSEALTVSESGTRWESEYQLEEFVVA